MPEIINGDYKLPFEVNNPRLDVSNGKLYDWRQIFSLAC